jgi:hypothetical protein
MGDRPAPAKVSIRTRIAEEIKAFLIISAYLSVCFLAIAYLKSAILQAYGISFAPFGFAIVKALICAKFILIGRAIHLGERYKDSPLIWPTLHKSVAFVVLLLILNTIEEIVVGAMHHRSVADSISEIGGGTLHQLIATTFVGLLILIPFFAFSALGDLLGDRNLFLVFFRPRRNAGIN